MEKELNSIDSVMKENESKSGFESFIPFFRNYLKKIKSWGNEMKNQTRFFDDLFQDQQKQIKKFTSKIFIFIIN